MPLDTEFCLLQTIKFTTNLRSQPTYDHIMKIRIINFMEKTEIYANNENIQIHIIKEKGN